MEFTIDLNDATLDMAAAIVDDLERVRIANSNRIRIMVSSDPDEDGVVRGWGMPTDHPNVVLLRDMVEALGELEKKAVTQLEKSMKNHPLGKWVGAQLGIGYKQAARLISSIGDPYINANTGQPRTVSQLWSYCGFAVIEGNAVRRKKGIKSNWNANAKMRTFLITLSCIKQLKSPYRAIYDARRLRTSETHPDWTLGHSHNDALRVMGKSILRELWIESRRLHMEAVGELETGAI